jgi:DNA uptake protein ComE-like DNA-binding protein
MPRRSAAVAALGLLVSLVAGCTLVDRIMRPAPPIGVDLNQASTAELARLPGSNGVTAERIVEARPYHAKSELVQRGIVSEETFARFADRVYVGRSS